MDFVRVRLEYSLPVFGGSGLSSRLGSHVDAKLYLQRCVRSTEDREGDSEGLKFFCQRAKLHKIQMTDSAGRFACNLQNEMRGSWLARYLPRKQMHCIRQLRLVGTISANVLNLGILSFEDEALYLRKPKESPFSSCLRFARRALGFESHSFGCSD